MKIAIYSQEPSQQDQIRTSIASFCKKNSYEVELCMFSRSNALLCCMQLGPPKILFFSMQSQQDIGIAQQARHYAPNCAIVFVSAFREFAIDAYRLDGISYLTSPVEEHEIFKVLKKCQPLLERCARTIPVRLAGQLDVSIALASICYIEVLNKQVIFHTEKQTIHAQNLTLNRVEELVGPYPFYRCHRCFIVNMNYVSCIVKRQFLLKNNETVMIHKNGFPQARLYLSNFLSREFREDDRVILEALSAR